MWKDEKAIAEMNQLGFSRWFINCIPPYGHCWHFRRDEAPVNVAIDFGEKLEKVRARLYPAHSWGLFRKRHDVDFVYSNEIFSMYRKKSKYPTYNRNYTPPVGMIVYGKRILAKFFVDYESEPTEIRTNVNGREVFFLNFLDKGETLAVIFVHGTLQAFTGLPFVIERASGPEIILKGGHKTTLSFETFGDDESELVFCF
jgi:hypothetical protein